MGPFVTTEEMDAWDYQAEIELDQFEISLFDEFDEL